VNVAEARGTARHTFGWWLGGQQTGQTQRAEFVWKSLSPLGRAGDVTLTEMTYTNWQLFEPDLIFAANSEMRKANCFYADTNDMYKWNDLACDTQQCSVCELDLAPRPRLSI